LIGWNEVIQFLLDWAKALFDMYMIIAPLLLLGLFIAGLMHLFLSEEQVTRLLGKRNKRSVFLGTLLAIPLPLCSCSVVPVVASLRRKGAAPGPSVSFLVAAPQIGADSFLLTQGLLGWPFAFVRMGASFVTALLAGLCESFASTKDPVFLMQPAAPSSSLKKRLSSVISHVDDLLGSLANNLLMGLVLAALIMVLLPEEALHTLLADRDWLGRVLMLLAGIPLYVCATASTPIAAALVLKGISPGAALVFLLTGPATNVLTLMLLKDNLGKRPLAIYLMSIAAVALLAGYLMDLFAPMLHLELLHLDTLHHGSGGLTLLGSIVLFLLLGRHYYMSSQDQSTSDERFSLRVEGMTCSHCSGRVREVVEALDFVRSARVDLEASMLYLEPKEGDLRPEQVSALKQCVVQAGFQVID
jgi:uncharacterized protein